MREGHMALDDFYEHADVPMIHGNKRKNRRQSADMLVADSALFWGNAHREVLKKTTVAFFNVCIAMLAGAEKKSHVAVEIILRIVSATRYKRLREEDGKIEVQCIFAALKELMIMNPSPAPVCGLLVENVRPGRWIFAAP